MNGTSSLKNKLNSFPTEWSLSWIEALLLIGGGVMAVVLHRALDTSPGLPGHHGIEWMAIMILGRASSRFRGAGTLTSIGASFASTLPMLHGDNPFTWMYYLLPGPVMDLAFPLSAALRKQTLVHGLARRFRAHDKTDRSTHRESNYRLADRLVPLWRGVSIYQPPSLWDDRWIARRTRCAWHSPHISQKR
ncbi:MAG: hypothetical protein IPN96_17020 [Anaerolineales bacterium]|nr:hypothetical protein [Anaerolineales bacterium]